MIQNLVAQRIQRWIDFLAEHQVLYYVGGNTARPFRLALGPGKAGDSGSWSPDAVDVRCAPATASAISSTANRGNFGIKFSHRAVCCWGLSSVRTW